MKLGHEILAITVLGFIVLNVGLYVKINTSIKSAKESAVSAKEINDGKNELIMVALKIINDFEGANYKRGIRDGKVIEQERMVERNLGKWVYTNDAYVFVPFDTHLARFIVFLNSLDETEFENVKNYFGDTDIFLEILEKSYEEKEEK